MKLTYAVVFEKAPNNYCAYVPELPVCVSTGRTWEEMQRMIREAMEFHIESIHEDGDPIPMPKMSIEEALEYHRSLIDGYQDEYFPEPVNPDDHEPYAILEVEVEVNLPAVPAPL